MNHGPGKKMPGGDRIDLDRQVRRVAALARLRLTDEELSQHTGQLARILEYVRQMDVGGGSPRKPGRQEGGENGPSTSTTLRPDRVEHDPDAAAALVALAPKIENGYFVSSTPEGLPPEKGGRGAPPRPEEPVRPPLLPDAAPSPVTPPPPGSLTALGARELSRLVRRREVTAEEVARRHLDRVDAMSWLGAFLAVDRRGALEAAQRVDAALDAGQDPGPLAGVPVALKDSLVTRGLETTCGSATLEGWIPAHEATVVSRLRRADAVILGKTNMDEFSMGSSCERSAFYPCKNPLDPTRVPGGSSGGSAAAVAAHLCAAALGSDTGGSIRQPAALCGVVGLKPTYGAVSRRGLIAFASSLDQVGPLARTVEDCALIMEVIAGHDPADSTSTLQSNWAYLETCGAGISGMRVGIPKDALFQEAEPRTAAAVERALTALQSAGARLVPVSLPHSRRAVAAYQVIATSEASSNLARYDGLRYGHQRRLGAEVKRRIMLGTFALSAGYREAYYARAREVCAMIRRDFEEAFSACDVIATPTTPGPAFPLGERMEDPLRMYLSDVFTTACNLAGLPGLSVPCGTVEAGLPVGLQLLGPAGGDGRVLAAAAAYRQQVSR